MSVFVSSAKHGRCIGSMTSSASSSSVSTLSEHHTFGFGPITFEGMHQFSQPLEGQDDDYPVPVNKHDSD